MSDLVPVRVRSCACPDSPHPDGDFVYVLPKLGLDGGLVAEADHSAALREAITASGLTPGTWTDEQQMAISRDAAERLRRRWLITFTRYGAAGWNFLDENGPVPFDVEVLLADFSLAYPVAEKCDDLFGDTVSRPLLYRLPTPSAAGPTESSTSQTPTPIQRPRKPSSPATSAASRRRTA